MKWFGRNLDCVPWFEIALDAILAPLHGMRQAWMHVGSMLLNLTGDHIRVNVLCAYTLLTSPAAK
jgi:hypothetical protein